MKKVLAMMTLSAVAMQANAAQMKTCVDHVRSACGRYKVLDALESIDASGTCSIVQRGESEQGAQFGEKVIFKDANTLFSVQLPLYRYESCKTTEIPNVRGVIKKSREFRGRLFNVMFDGRVIVIGRDNRAVYLINSHSKPYVSVADITIGSSDVLVTFENGQSHSISWDEVTKKLNSPQATILDLRQY